MTSGNPSSPWHRNFSRFFAKKPTFPLSATIREFKLAAREAYQCTRIQEGFFVSFPVAVFHFPVVEPLTWSKAGKVWCTNSSVSWSRNGGGQVPVRAPGSLESRGRLSTVV